MPKVCRKHSSTIETIPNSFSIESNIFKIKEKLMDADFAFYLVNLGSVVHQFARWKACLPRVQPFFAVKCQPDPKVISLLGKLGVGFDCASKEEIKIVTEAMKFKSLDASKKIIYANPYKFKKDIFYANRVGVTLTAFDTENELIKLSKEWPSAQLVMRLSPQRSYNSTCVLGNKFGVDPEEVSTLLYRAKELSMDIVGFSFHVGSGCKELNAFPETVIYCSKVMELARNIGFNPYLLDIGGGFPGLSSISDDIVTQLEFEEMCLKLNNVLDVYFPNEDNYQIIAEPGRYFVMGAYTLATQVIGKRSLDIYNRNSDDATVACSKTDSHTDHYNDFSNIDSSSSYSLNFDDLLDSSSDIDNYLIKKEACTKSIKEPNSTRGYRYVINDGVYNSFNCIVFDHAKPFPYGIFDADGNFHELVNNDQLFVSTLYGPTCDGFDCVLQQVNLPQMEVGDWMIWPNMGAYTVAASSCFNGIQVAKRHYFICKNDMLEMDKMCSRNLSKRQIEDISGSKIMIVMG